MKKNIFNLLKYIIIFLVLLSPLLNGCINEKEISLTINSNPQDADIYVKPLYGNDKWVFYGKSPLSLKLKKGDYEIRIEKDNYLIERKKIKIYKKDEVFNFKLNKVPILWKKPLSSNSLIFVDNLSICFTGGASRSDMSNKEAIHTVDLSVGKTIWSISIDDIYKFLKRDFLLSHINYTGDKINLYYFSIEKYLATEILFLTLENGKIVGNLTTYPIFFGELGKEPQDKIEKTFIKFYSPSLGYNWIKETKGYFKFISYFNKKLYFLGEDNNKKTKIVIINSDTGNIDKEILFEDIQDADIVDSKLCSGYEDKIYFTSYINGKFKLTSFSLIEEKILYENSELLNLPITITEDIIYQVDIENTRGITIDADSGKIIKELSPKTIETLNIPFEGKIMDIYTTNNLIFITSLDDLQLYCFDIEYKELIFKYNEEKILSILGSKGSILFLLNLYGNIITIDLNRL